LDDDDAAMLGDQLPKKESFPVQQANWQAVSLFAACSTQWRWHEVQRLGLIYSEVNVLMDIYDVKDKQDCLERIRIMETEVLDASCKK